MKKTISIISASVLAALALTGCTDKADMTIHDLAIKADISLGSRYCPSSDFKSTGAIVAEKWKKEDKVILKLENDGNAVEASASPLLAGQLKSLFLFNISTRNGETPALAYTPEGAEFEYSGEKLRYSIPAQQTIDNVPQAMFDLTNIKVGAYSPAGFNLRTGSALLLVNVAMGDYEVSSIEITANGGEALAGDIEYDMNSDSFTASSKSVTFTPSSPVSCLNGGVYLPVYCVPGKLSSGITAKITTAKGDVMTSSTNEEIVLERGSRVCTAKMAESESTELVFCGDNHVFVINASVISNSYKEGIIWEWDAKKIASVLGLAESRCDHLDDCKIVDNGSKLLLTSSYGWCVLMEYPSGNVLFHTTQVPNAHSAEYIPEGNGYVAVATSGGTSTTSNQVQLYDVTKSEKILASETLTSGHGVVWDAKRKVLYAGGSNIIKTLEIDGPGTDQPSFKLKKQVQAPQGGIHDLFRVDENTISVAGNKAYLYNVEGDSFTEIPLFSKSTAIKSLNYNGETGEMWYTDATVPEGNEDWSSQKIRYNTKMDASEPERIITVDIDMYKVRVKNW